MDTSNFSDNLKIINESLDNITILNSRLADNTAEINRLKQLLEQKTSEYDAMKQSLTDIKDQHAAAVLEVKSANEKLEDAARAIKECESLANVDQTDESRTRRQSAIGDMAKARRSSVLAESKLNKLSLELAAKTAEEAQLKNDLQQLKEKLVNTEAELVKEKSERMDTKDTQISVLNENIKQKDKNIDVLTKQLNNMSGKVAGLESKLRDALLAKPEEEDIDYYNKQIEDLTTEISQLKIANQELKQKSKERVALDDIEIDMGEDVNENPSVVNIYQGDTSKQLIKELETQLESCNRAKDRLRYENLQQEKKILDLTIDSENIQDLNNRLQEFNIRFYKIKNAGNIYKISSSKLREIYLHNKELFDSNLDAFAKYLNSDTYRGDSGLYEIDNCDGNNSIDYLYNQTTKIVDSLKNMIISYRKYIYNLGISNFANLCISDKLEEYKSMNEISKENNINNIISDPIESYNLGFYDSIESLLEVIYLISEDTVLYGCFLTKVRILIGANIIDDSIELSECMDDTLSRLENMRRDVMSSKNLLEQYSDLNAAYPAFTNGISDKEVKGLNEINLNSVPDNPFDESAHKSPIPDAYANNPFGPLTHGGKSNLSDYIYKTITSGCAMLSSPILSWVLATCVLILLYLIYTKIYLPYREKVRQIKMKKQLQPVLPDSLYYTGLLY